MALQLNVTTKTTFVETVNVCAREVDKAEGAQRKGPHDKKRKIKEVVT